jgi:hypothetical protein
MLGAAALGALVSGVLSGCGTSSSSAATSVASDTPSPPATGEIVPMGMRVDTTKGHVVVYSYIPLAAGPSGPSPAPGDTFGAADIEACAGPTADANTGISTARFHLQIGKFTLRASAPAKQPALVDAVLAPNQCARGWLTFELPQGTKPGFIVFQSTKVIGWRIP